MRESLFGLLIGVSLYFVPTAPAFASALTMAVMIAG